MTILSVSPVNGDHAALRQVLEGLATVEPAGDCRTALQRLAGGDISIVVCEGGLPDGTWRDILDSIGSSQEAPLLIVTSRGADEYLWAEVLNRGGYDVIAKPFNPRETRHILETACLSRQSKEPAQHCAAG